MEISEVKSNGITTLALTGRLDTTTASQFQDKLIPALEAARSVVIDFADISYVSSAGLRVLLTGERTAASNGSRLTLTNISEDVMEVFEMTGFSEILNIE